MTADPSVSAAVAQAVQNNGHVLVTVSARDPRELTAHLVRDPSAVVLVDLDPQPAQVLEGVERVALQFPGTRFVALTGEVQSDLLMEAMQAGVRRVMTKQSIAADLHGVLSRLAPPPSPPAGPAGDVVTVLSASGGCGATTVAANLANELGAQQPGHPALLVDLDACYGALAIYFGQDPTYAIDHVLNYDRRPDTELIRSTATIISTRLHLLASPVSTSFFRPEPLNFERLEDVVTLAGHAYRHTVIDAPRLPMNVVGPLVLASKHVLLTFQLCVKDLRVARAMLDALDAQGVPRSHVVPVANRYFRGSEISPEDGGKVLGGMKLRTLRNDYPAAIKGFNFGQTLAEASPKSSFRRDLLDLIAALALVRPG